VSITAERVPDVDDPPCLRRDRGYVPLVGRRVADVAAGRREDQPARVVQRGSDLLARRQTRDPDRPAAGAHLLAARRPQLVDPPVRGRRVDEAPPGSDDRGCVRDPLAAGPGCVAGRGERPQTGARSRVDGERLSIRGSDDEDVVLPAADSCRAEVDRRRVDRSREAHLLPLQAAEIRGRDSRPGGTRVMATGVVAEPRPVAAGTNGRALRCLRAATGARHAEGEQGRDEHRAHYGPKR
jgi:hypothetical protein